MRKLNPSFLKIAIGILLFAIIYRTSDAQKTEYEKNSMYITAGLVYSLTVCYEREIKSFDQNKRIIIRGIGGYGIRIFEFEGPVAAIMFDWIRGGQNNHLEYGAGISAEIMEHISYNRDYKLWPAVNIGYRYQKPDGNFIFRTGGGWPEAAYVSLGFAF